MLVKNVTMYFAKLIQPSYEFDDDGRWEVQIRTEDSEVADEWLDLRLNVNKRDGYWYTSFHTKARNKDGEKMRPPRVVDAGLQPLEDPGIIGNGSVGNIQFVQKEYKKSGKVIVGNHLVGVQVLKLVPYSGGSGLEFADEGEMEIESRPLEDEDDTPKKEKKDKKDKKDKKKKKGV